MPAAAGADAAAAVSAGDRAADIGNIDADNNNVNPIYIFREMTCQR